MLSDTKWLDKFTKRYTQIHTDFKPNEIKSLPLEKIEQAAKTQVEFLFGQTNYTKDTFIRSFEGKDKWILLDKIYNHDKVRKYHSRLSVQDLYDVLQVSYVVDVKVEI